ncbi:MAG: hypothetical protein BWY16_00679 [Candidatus Omnitrophica bacterium ADurb.Bin205]|nr:MAG: hypothetical protein BWY16_00679 [Candidatus Omnitrophica bacterium ADurb.Bin205]
MTLSKLRKPCVSGRFYPKSAQEIKKMIAGFLGVEKAVKTKATGCILPHAGYIYSGKVAARALSQLDIPEKIILLGPNHTGSGPEFSIMCDGLWETPLGEVSIDSKLSRLLLGESNYLQDDSSAHMQEHSLEVELPILQYFSKGFEIVPITLKPERLNILRDIGIGIAGTIKNHNYNHKILLLASSDMTHYESEEDARIKDKRAIDAILTLDEEGLMESVDKFHISMCGCAPVAVMLSCAKALGATKGRLAMYQTSAEASGDKTSVVGYAGIIIN